MPLQSAPRSWSRALGGIALCVTGAAAPAPAQDGWEGGGLARIATPVQAAVDRGSFPGGVLLAGRGDRVLLERGFGTLSWEGGGVAPSTTVYDLASLTKVVATTSAVMALWEDGRLDLDAPVSAYLPGFSGPFRDQGPFRITVRHLLTHRAGFPAGADITAPTREEALRIAYAVPLVSLPGRRVIYSDIGFVVLWEVAERIAGEPLYGFLDRRVFGPLGMRATTFRPGAGCRPCAPTLADRPGESFRGVVHDPTARRLGGITGNAGLFATAPDLGRFAAMMANRGELEGRRIFEAATIDTFTRRVPGASSRALGWDTPGRNPERGAAGLGMSERAYGHTGFTGTSLWIDPATGAWTVLLTNRTYEPRHRAPMQAIRREVHGLVSGAARITGPGASEGNEDR